MFRTLSTAALLGLLTISAASAQSARAIQANIPFDFSIGNRTMNAGGYRLAFNATAGILTVRGLDRKEIAVFATARPSGMPAPRGPGKLVFDCYGGACSLAKVVPPGVTGDRNLQVSEPAHHAEIAMQTRVVLLAEK